MYRSIPETHPIHRLFRGLTEGTFMTELGIADPELLDYVADMLARFVPCSSIWAIRDAQGNRLVEVTEMVAQAETAADAQRRRECHRHIGDYTLFWTGVYPEAIAKLRRAQSADCLLDFQRQGKQSYFLAGTLDADEQSPVFRRLSAEFELCAFGLSRVRQEWEKAEVKPPRGPNPPQVIGW